MSVPRMLPHALALALLPASAFAWKQPVPTSAESPLTAEAIMARVASNQDRAQSDRARYVYVQHARVLSRRGKTVMCEEVTDSRFTPTATGSRADLLKLDGRLLLKKTYVNYTTLPRATPGHSSPVENSHDSLSISVGDENDDRDLVENMRSNLTTDASKDGVDHRLFPLTSDAQANVLFHLVGRDHVNGRDVFHIEFHPKDKADFGWKGNAYIDISAFEPVVISTAMSRKIPFAVRTLLGTSVPGLGFTIIYAPQTDGVWFPVSLGTEFKLHVLFFFNREIVIQAENRKFEKTHVTTEMVHVGDPIQQK